MATPSLCRGCDQVHDPLKPCPPKMAGAPPAPKAARRAPTKAPTPKAKKATKPAGGVQSAKIEQLQAKIAAFEAEKAAAREAIRIRVAAWRKAQKAKAGVAT